MIAVLIGASLLTALSGRGTGDQRPTSGRCLTTHYAQSSEAADPDGPRDRALIWLYMHVVVGRIQRFLCFLMHLEAIAPAPIARALSPLVEAVYAIDAVARAMTWDELSDEAQEAAIPLVVAFLAQEPRHG